MQICYPVVYYLNLACTIIIQYHYNIKQVLIHVEQTMEVVVICAC